MIRNLQLILCLLFCGAASAAPKIAVVKVKEIVPQLDATKEMQATFRAKRLALTKDPRLDAYRTSRKELETLQTALLKAADLDRSTRLRAEQKFSIKRQEVWTLQRELHTFNEKRKKEIDTEMVEWMERILADIHRTAAEVGKKKGYDLVFDISGNTNTHLPFLLYSKNSEDITSDVLAAMGHTIAETTQDEEN